MSTFDDTVRQINRLLASGLAEDAEQVVDQLADMDSGALDRMWDFGAGDGRDCLSVFYNNIGGRYQGIGIQALGQDDRAAALQAAQGAERCHEKALDMYDMSLQAILFLPSTSPLNKNLIFTCWGAGSAKYILGKHHESRRYLEMCLRIPAEDAQAYACQSDASNYLRLLDAQPVRLALKAASVMPNLVDPRLLQVQGELLEWDVYARPLAEGFAVYVTDDDIERLQAWGFENAIALEGHVLVLDSDPSGDLSRPLHIAEVL